MDNQQIRHILARASFGIVFAGFGIWEILQPSYWSFYVPSFVAGMIGIDFFVELHGIVLLLIGLAVMLGVYLRISASLGVLMMALIIGDLVYLSGFSDIVLRDMALLLIALSLAFDDTPFLRLCK